MKKRIDEKKEIQIRRIEKYENIMREAEMMLDGRTEYKEDAMQDMIDELTAYYGSREWKKDFADDEAGRLPEDLKRGVLSEDGIYDLIERYKDQQI